MLACESRTSSAALVIAVVATAVVLSAPVTTAVVPARAYARAQRGAAAALASSSVFPRPPTPAWRSHASSGLDPEDLKPVRQREKRRHSRPRWPSALVLDSSHGLLVADLLTLRARAPFIKKTLKRERNPPFTFVTLDGWGFIFYRPFSLRCAT